MEQASANAERMADFGVSEAELAYADDIDQAGAGTAAQEPIAAGVEE